MTKTLEDMSPEELTAAYREVRRRFDPKLVMEYDGAGYVVVRHFGSPNNLKMDIWQVRERLIEIRNSEVAAEKVRNEKRKFLAKYGLL